MGDTLLELDGIAVTYGGAAALHGLSLSVLSGEIVALIGPNGAGKTTTLRAASGLLDTQQGRVVSGEVVVDGRPMRNHPARAFVRAGVVHCLEGRRLFPQLTVAENVRLGGAGADGPTWSIAELEDAFPVLARRRDERAGLLSGGEQQLVAIARALVSKPRLLLLDEPTLGLAPILVDQVMELVASLPARGLTVLLVEQHATTALAVADRSYVIESGRATPTAEGPVAAEASVVSAYFGSSSGTDLVDPRRRAPWI